MRDVRFALRGIRREPGFALFIVLTLALATGANAALFGIADRLLIRGPEHVQEPDRVVRVYVTSQPTGMRQFTSAVVGHVAYDALSHASSAEAVATYSIDESTIGRGPQAREAKVGWVSAGFFPLLGVQPALGRFFAEAEDSIAAARRVVVISDGTWRRQFGGALDVIGRSIVINDEPYDIVGVAPAGFTGAELGPADAWAPINLIGPRVTPDWTRSWCCQWLTIVVRLRPGVTNQSANSELTTLFRNRYDGGDAYMKQARVWLGELGLDGAGTEPDEARVTRWLSIVASLVLLIACANIMNLLLARGARRAREVGIREALGASRFGLVRMFVIESMLLAVAGGAAGLFVAHVVGGIARSTLLSSIEWPSQPVDGRVLVASLAVSTMLGLVVGVVPALRITRGAVARALRSGAREGGGGRAHLRAGLTIVQTTLSVALLIGAGLFVRSVWNARHVDLGFDPDRVTVVETSRSPLSTVLEPARSAERERRRAFLAEALDRVRLIPGVEQASVAVGLPFGFRFGAPIAVPGLDALPQTGTGGPGISAVDPAYFRAMGTEVVRGRAFTTADRGGSAPVAIVSEFMATTVWPGADPLGKCLLIGSAPSGCATVVGVAADTHRAALVERPKMHVYIPLGHEVKIGFGGAVLLIRAGADAPAPAEAVRRLLMAADPTITFVRSETLATRIAPQMRSWELGTATLMFSGLLALLVCAVGIYSLLSYLVADRRHEIGVRMALGASTDHVAAMVVRWSLGMAIAGVTAGSVLAALAAGFLQPLLFQVSARDPVVFGSVAATLLLVALAASLVPGLRAARVDPLEALRTE